MPRFSSLRPVFLALLLVLPGALRAACQGDDLRDALTPQQHAGMEAEIAAAPFGRGNYWIARRGSRTVHVIGTLHVNDPRMDALERRLAPVIAGADLLLLEASPAEKAAFERELGLTPELTLITEGPSLIDRLPPQEWQALSEQLHRQGIPPWMAAKMRPWFRAMSLSIPRCVMQVKDYRNGLDLRLAALADRAGVAVRSLEDPMDVIRMLDADPLEEQIRHLRIYTALLGGGEDLFQTTAEAYFDQEPLAALLLSRQAFLGTEGLPQAERRQLWQRSMRGLLDQRNRAWIPVIEAAAGETIVVAAGALHLPGEAGVLNLLQQQGYALSRGSWD